MVEAKGKKSKKDDIFESVSDSDSDSNSEDNNNDEDYITYLSKLKLQELKALVMSLKNHFKFSMVGKKKGDFIEYILKYTKMEDGVIKLLEQEIKVVEKKLSKQDQMKYIYKLKGRITKLEDIINDNNIDNENPKKNKKDNKPLLKEIEEIKKEIKMRTQKLKEDKEKEEDDKPIKKVDKPVDIKKLDVNELKVLLFGQRGKLSRLNREMEGMSGKQKKMIENEIDEVKKYMNNIKDMIKNKEKEESSDEEDDEDKFDMEKEHKRVLSEMEQRKMKKEERNKLYESILKDEPKKGAKKEVKKENKKTFGVRLVERDPSKDYGLSWADEQDLYKKLESMSLESLIEKRDNLKDKISHLSPQTQKDIFITFDRVIDLKKNK